jgi:DNA-binding protein H-NS
MNTTSKVHELRQLEASIAELTARAQELQPQVQAHMEVFKSITEQCDARGISRREMALELCPELATGARTQAAGGKKTRRARTVKVYKNPHNGEVIETKGGNHKALKGWKEQFGADVVESWVQAA